MSGQVAGTSASWPMKTVRCISLSLGARAFGLISENDSRSEYPMHRSGAGVAYRYHRRDSCGAYHAHRSTVPAPSAMAAAYPNHRPSPGRRVPLRLHVCNSGLKACTARILRQRGWSARSCYSSIIAALPRRPSECCERRSKRASWGTRILREAEREPSCVWGVVKRRCGFWQASPQQPRRRARVGNTDRRHRCRATLAGGRLNAWRCRRGCAVATVLFMSDAD